MGKKPGQDGTILDSGLKKGGKLILFSHSRQK
jgi:hypothetical protein